ncbi:hypothetical protein WDU94_009161 [Cyamophila willieti]
MMQTPQPHNNTFTVVLRRPNRHHTWGLRIAGGCDLQSPIVVTKVYPSTPAAAELKRGDIIRKISDYDARDVRHKDATNLFQTSDTSIILAVQRSPSGEKKQASSSRSVTPLPGIVDYCQKESKASSTSTISVESYHNYIDHQHAHRALAVASPFDYNSQEDLNHMIKEQIPKGKRLKRKKRKGGKGEGEKREIMGQEDEQKEDKEEKEKEEEDDKEEKEKEKKEE